MEIDLKDFLLNKMQMSHVYQPAMLKDLVQGDGVACLHKIAAAILSYYVS